MSTTMTRTFCTRCGTFRFKEPEQLCYHCSRGAKVECPGGASAPPGQTETITFGGATIDAPGFDREGFEKALCRAFVDELVIVQDQTGQDVVCHAGTNGGYFTSRHTCSCPAGVHGCSCKHRAFWIFVHDVRLPIQRRQWAAAARKAVAA
jgi:hypothetical protein